MKSTQPQRKLKWLGSLVKVELLPSSSFAPAPLPPMIVIYQLQLVSTVPGGCSSGKELLVLKRDQESKSLYDCNLEFVAQIYV